MSAYKQLSHYYSEDKKKTASIIKELGTGHYVVKMINDSGSAFTASFDEEADAEAYAEDWVL